MNIYMWTRVRKTLHANVFVLLLISWPFSFSIIISIKAERKKKEMN
jgi:hypothetical protein